MHSNPIAPDNEKGKENDDTHSANEAQLLTDNGKNVVVVFFGKVQMLLPPHAKAQAE